MFQLVLVLMAAPNPVDDGRIKDPGIMVQEKHVALANDGMILEPDVADWTVPDEDPFIIEATTGTPKAIAMRVDDGRDLKGQSGSDENPIIIGQRPRNEGPVIIG